MKNSKAFTIIELIFVVVVIGILTAIAIPVLVSTRDDAKVVQIVTNLKTFTEDIKSYYTANGEDATANPSGAWGVATYDKVTKTIPSSIASVVKTDSNATFNIDSNTGVRCFKVTEATKQAWVNGIRVNQKLIEITDGLDASTSVCKMAIQLANKKGLHNPGGIDTIVFAAQRVTF